MVGTIRSLTVQGAQRLEADTVRSYVSLRPGQNYTAETLDQALKDLNATELFADVAIGGADTGNIVLQVRENPLINRIVLEGNKRLKEDKIRPEIKLAPRQIFTRSKVRADVARIVELYRRQGRFAASVEPKMVQLDQNRVDIVFEISEGARSKVRQINIIGNDKFSDDELRQQFATKQSRWFNFLSSGSTYDPDKLNFDQQKLRQFYLTNGYADIRVISAVAELTPDKRDFVITYVVEEGARYHFGDVTLESEIRDIKADDFRPIIAIKKGDWYNAKLVEDTLDALGEATGLLGYTPDVRPDFVRDAETKTMNIAFLIRDAPRVYVEDIVINGNTVTRDKVIRREFRLTEGDAFNNFRVKRSRDRIQSLGYFQDKLEINEKPGTAPDRKVLEVNVEEKSTGELQLSAGFSSLERFILDASIQQRNFRGLGQVLRAGVNYSSYSKSIELGFTEPYLFDQNIAVGGDIFRRDLRSFNYLNNQRNTTYNQVSTGFQLRAGVPITEFWSLALRYQFSIDDITLDRSTYYYDTNSDGTNDTCDPLVAGRYLCDQVGNRTTSAVGYSLVFDNLNNRIRPSGGQRVILSQDFAGLGGSVRYAKTRFDADKYWAVGGGFIASLGIEGGATIPLQSRGAGVDPVRLTDRWFLGSPQIRGFDIRGVGPRILRQGFNTDGTLITQRNRIADDALGGRYYYLSRAELEIPLGSGARELGLRPSIFLDAGALWGLKRPEATATFPDTNGDGIPDPITRPIRDANGNLQYSQVTTVNGTSTTTLVTAPIGPDGKPNALYGTPIAPFVENFLGDTPKPRVSVGFGVNWNSPFGPLRIDIAKALLKAKGDDDKLFTFNVGTQF